MRRGIGGVTGGRVHCGRDCMYVSTVCSKNTVVITSRARVLLTSDDILGPHFAKYSTVSTSCYLTFTSELHRPLVTLTQAAPLSPPVLALINRRHKRLFFFPPSCSWGFSTIRARPSRCLRS